MAKSRRYLISVSLVVAIILFLSVFFIKYNTYLFISLSVLALTMIPFLVRFEMKDIAGREIVILAILAAIAAVSRIPFAGLPGIQPTSFIIIMTGIVFGAESGFIVGAIAALASNFFLGQGPWTPWQMYAWGMMGMLAGLLRNSFMLKSQLAKCVYGFGWGFLFGWFMNIWVIITQANGISLSLIFTIFLSSFLFDLAHALSNVFFILIFGKSWIKILTRFKIKYGLLDQDRYSKQVN